MLATRMRQAAGASREYYQRILATQPDNLIALWRLNETSGTVAANAQGTTARDGTYTGAGYALNSTPFFNGDPAPVFSGTGFVNVYSTSLRDAFGKTKGTMMIWGKMANAGVWTDGALREAFYLSADANNEALPCLKLNTSNTLLGGYRAAGTLDSVSTTSIAGSTAWHQYVVTWDKTAEQMIWYIDGAQVGTTQVTLGTWTLNLSSTRCCIGAQTTTPAQTWNGYLSHAALWSVALSAPEVAALYDPF